MSLMFSEVNRTTDDIGGFFSNIILVELSILL